MEHHSLSKSIRLHVGPGLLVILIYIIITPWLNEHGYPSLLALSIAAFVGIIPLQVGHLLMAGYQLNGVISLKGVVLPRERLPFGKFALLVLGSLLLLFCIGGISFIIEEKIKVKFFGWLPGWYFYGDNLRSFSKEALMTTAIVRLVIDGFMLPITEELYFRGYLFSRLPLGSKSKWVVAAGLFAVYHFWQPWNYASLFLISLVLVGIFARFRNVYLTIAVHMIANLIGAVLFFGQIQHA